MRTRIRLQHWWRCLLALAIMSVCSMTTVAAAEVVSNSTAAYPQESYVSTAGDDSHEGLSPGRALRTISQALLRARPGGTINVGPGTYYEQIVSVTAGAPGAEITIKSPAGAAVIDGSALNWVPASDQNRAVIELHHPFIRLVGLTVRNTKNAGILVDADDLTVEDCVISDTQLHGAQHGHCASGGERPQREND